MRHSNVLGLLLISAVALSACGRGPPHSIVPIPRSFETGEGVFVLDAASAIGLIDPSDTEARDVVELWAPVRVGTGLALPLPVDTVYSYEPVPTELTPTEARRGTSSGPRRTSGPNT